MYILAIPMLPDLSAQNECAAIHEMGVQRVSGCFTGKPFLKMTEDQIFKNEESGTAFHCLPRSFQTFDAD